MSGGVAKAPFKPFKKAAPRVSGEPLSAAQLADMAHTVEQQVRQSVGNVCRFVAAKNALTAANFTADDVERFMNHIAVHKAAAGTALRVPNGAMADRQQWAFVVDGLPVQVPPSRAALAKSLAAVDRGSKPPAVVVSAAPAAAVVVGGGVAVPGKGPTKGMRTLSVSEPFVVVQSGGECAAALSWLLVQRAVGLKTIGSTDVDGHYTARALLVSTPLPADDSREGTYVFDFETADRSVRLAIAHSVATLLASPSVVKVAHDVRLDFDAMRRVPLSPPAAGAAAAALELARVFDTQVMLKALAEMRALHARVPVADRATLDDALRAVALPPTAEATLANSSNAVFWRLPSTQLTAELVGGVVARHMSPLLALYARLVRQFDVNVGLLSSMNVRWFGSQTVAARVDATLVGQVARLAFERSAALQQVVAVRTPLSECAARPADAGPPPPPEAVRVSDELEFELLLDVLPTAVRDALLALVDGDVAQLCGNVAQVHLELGRPLSLRWRSGATQTLRQCVVKAADFDAMQLLWTQKNVVLRHDNRVVLERALHRLCVVRDGGTRIVAAVAHVRVQRNGTVPLIFDVVSRIIDQRRSLLVLGAADNTRALLRELAATLAERLLVVVVDANGDLGGDHIEKHRSLGNAVRLIVNSAIRGSFEDAQASAMFDAAQNLRALVVVVDEIVTQAQVDCARRLIGAGVVVLAGSRAATLRDACARPELQSLLGHGPHGKLPSKFCDMLVEVRAVGDVVVHEDLQRSLASLGDRNQIEPAVTSQRWSDVAGNQWCRFLQRARPQSADAAAQHAGALIEWLHQL